MPQNSATPPTFGFTGELQDPATGLVYFRARWYQPANGSFLSRDPFSGFDTMPYSLHPYQSFRWQTRENFFRNPASLHPYSYVHNNPVNWTDPTGKCIPWIDPDCQPIWETGRGPNWQDGGAYAWDVFQGIGSPGAWIADQFTGANTWECIWSEPTIGKVLGGTFTVTTVGGATYKYVAAPVWSWLTGGGSVWHLEPFARGTHIEQRLGQNLPQNFPVIDRFQNGVATSIKSIDLNAATYQHIPTLHRTVTGYIDKVAAYQGQPVPWSGVQILPNQITSRALDLAIPAGGSTPAQQAALQTLQQYAANQGVNLNIIPIR